MRDGSNRKANTRRHPGDSGLWIAASVAALLACGASPAAAQAEAPVCIRLMYAVTGDRLVVNGERYRLWGIDAPDLDQPCANADGQAFACGRAAKALLQDMTHTAPLACRILGQSQENLPLLTCELGGFDLGGMMVASGYAFDDPAVSGGAYAQQEQGARAERLGMWAGPFVTPADWRRRQIGIR